MAAATNPEERLLSGAFWEAGPQPSPPHASNQKRVCAAGNGIRAARLSCRSVGVTRPLRDYDHRRRAIAMGRLKINFVENTGYLMKRSTVVSHPAAFAAVLLPKKFIDGWRSAGSCAKDGPCCRG